MDHTQEIPKTGVQFFIKVGSRVYTFDHQLVKGRDILLKAGKNPDTTDLYQYSSGTKKLIGNDDIVDLSTPGIEKFRPLAKTLKDGRGETPPPPLTDDDLDFLNLGLEWEIISWKKSKLLIIKNYEIVNGYTQKHVDILLVLPTTYPSAQIDMFYISPNLTKLEGRAIPATSAANFNDKKWQCWSRHRTADNPWIPGVDNVESHLALLDIVLEKELGR